MLDIEWAYAIISTVKKIRGFLNEIYSEILHLI
jgi:hypothetical protein